MSVQIDALLGLALQLPLADEKTRAKLFASPVICTPVLFAAAMEDADELERNSLEMMRAGGYLVVSETPRATARALRTPTPTNRKARRKDGKRK